MTRSLILTSLACGALLAPAAVAPAAPADGLHIHAIFSGGRSSGLSVGEPLAISYRSGKLRAKRICWTPAPIESPACAWPKTFRAPSQAGTQHLRIALTDGTFVTRTFHVGPAATTLPGFSGRPSQPLRVSCATRLFRNVRKDGRLIDPDGTLQAGTHVAAYYRVKGHGRIVQVWAYNPRAAGFVDDACLEPAASRTRIG